MHAKKNRRVKDPFSRTLNSPIPSWLRYVLISQPSASSWPKLHSLLFFLNSFRNQDLGHSYTRCRGESLAPTSTLFRPQISPKRLFSVPTPPGGGYRRLAGRCPRKKQRPCQRLHSALLRHLTGEDRPEFAAGVNQPNILLRVSICVCPPYDLWLKYTDAPGTDLSPFRTRRRRRIAPPVRLRFRFSSFDLPS
jgi:hypothetical protein